MKPQGGFWSYNHDEPFFITIEYTTHLPLDDQKLPKHLIPMLH